MQSDNKFIDDMGKLATGALGMVQSLRDEVETMVRQRLERAIADLDVVTRDEFEAVKSVAVELKSENEELKNRIAALEQATKATKKRTRSSTKSSSKATTRSGTKSAAASKGASSKSGGSRS